MGKKPKKLSLTQRTIALIKRNPWKTAAAAIPALAALPGAVLGASLFVPALPVLHYEISSFLEPIVKVQNTQALSIDRFLLYRQEQDLKAIQSEPALPTSPNLQKDQKELEDQVRETKERICKATGKKC